MLTDDELKAKLGADVYEALMAKLSAPSPSASDEWKQWAKGAVKSWTNWFGAFLIAWPVVQPQLMPMLNDLIGQNATNHLIQGVGVIVILLRIKTNQSLKAKGA